LAVDANVATCIDYSKLNRPIGYNNVNFSQASSFRNAFVTETMNRRHRRLPRQTDRRTDRQTDRQRNSGMSRLTNAWQIVMCL